MHPLLKPRHPLIQVPIDIAAIFAWCGLGVGIPAAAVWSIIVLVFLH